MKDQDRRSSYLAPLVQAVMEGTLADQITNRLWQVWQAMAIGYHSYVWTRLTQSAMEAAVVFNKWELIREMPGSGGCVESNVADRRRLTELMILLSGNRQRQVASLLERTQARVLVYDARRC